MKHAIQTISICSLAITCFSAVPPVRAWDAQVELLSTTTCKLENRRLVECKIPKQTVSGSVTETAVPVRTRVRVTKKGDCTTQFPLEVTLAVSGEPATTLLYLKNAEATLRKRNGLPIPKVKITDSSPWTSQLNVPGSSRVNIQVIANEADVYSKKEAQALLSKLKQDLTKKQTEVEWYKHLAQYHRAFLFLESVTENFHDELTSDMVQDLREGAQGAISSLSMLSSECDDHMEDTDRQNIMLLLMSLPQLGSPKDWKNPDGSSKTLSEFMGSDAAKIYDTAIRLAQENDAATGSNYDAELKRVSTEAAALEYKLALAKSQLAAWL
jgi:hypothetical protein